MKFHVNKAIQTNSSAVNIQWHYESNQFFVNLIVTLVVYRMVYTEAVCMCGCSHLLCDQQMVPVPKPALIWRDFPLWIIFIDLHWKLKSRIAHKIIHWIEKIVQNSLNSPLLSFHVLYSEFVEILENIYFKIHTMNRVFI